MSEEWNDEKFDLAFLPLQYVNNCSLYFKALKYPVSFINKGGRSVSFERAKNGSKGT